MKKIKITLTNGSTIEKPVLTAFKGTYGDYVVLDNESVGSMGLPVILISKMQDDKLSTIVDANEWNAIKDNLRNIIAGNQIVKTEVKDAYTGDDVYYKQLTLPIASFDALKNTYDEGNGGTANVQAPTPAADISVNPAMPGASPVPTVEPAPMPTSAPSVNPTATTPVMPNNVNPESVSAEQVEQVPVQPMPNVSSVGPMAPNENVAPVVETPVASTVEPAPMPNPTPTPEITPVAPEMPMPPMNEMAQESPAPVVEPIPAASEGVKEPVDVAADKDAFLKACENMFDALVAKFNK